MKKRLLSGLSYGFIALLFLLFTLLNGVSPVSAVSGVTAAAVASNLAPTVGQTITVTISIDMSGSGGQKLGSYTGSLNWNTSVLSYKSHTGAPPPDFAGVVNTASAATGTITFNAANASGATGSIVVVEVTFDVVGAGNANLVLAFSAMAAATTFNNLLPISITQANVTAVSVPCYALSLTHTGSGSNPVASPTHSTNCQSGQYIEGQEISLSGAVPSSSWKISAWTGTTSNSSTASTNNVIMPASAHAASVIYIQEFLLYLPCTFK